MTLIYRPAAIPTVLSLALLALYLAFPTKVYYWDGIAFAQAIEDAPEVNIALAHPNHLLYNFVGYYFYQLLRTVGADLRAVTALQILNSILSAASAALLFVILRDTLRSIYLSLCLALLFALSATWWKFSTDANAYIPSVFFLLLSFYLVLPDRKPAPLLVALSFFVAMCFHQLAVVAFPVFALGVYLQDGSIAIRRRVLNAVTFTMAAFVLIAAAYALLFYLAIGSFNLARFWRWTVSYSADAETGFNLWANLGYSARGQVRLFFGGRLNLLRGLINPGVVLLLAAFAVAVLLLVASALWNLPKLGSRLHGVRLLPRQKTVLLLAIVWAGVYLAFLFFWLPQNTFYRLCYLPALILLLGFALAALIHRASRRTFATALFVAAVGLANFLFLVYPFSHVEKYPRLAFALQVGREWPPGTVIYYAAENSDEELVRYFNRTTHWKLLVNELPQTGTPAWLETTAIDRLSATPEGTRWLQSHTRPESLREFDTGAHRIRFIQVVP